MELNMKDLGKRIRTRRNGQKIKQSELAEKLGISDNHISRIENGKDKPSLELFVRLCGALDVTPDYLLLGNMHSSDVPADITDNLRLCSTENIELIRHLLVYLTENAHNGKV